MVVPEALRDSLRRWNETGRRAQANRWNPQAWRKQLPEHAGLFDEMGAGPVSREAAASWAARIAGPESAERAFIVAMVWGHGPNGYGAYRTKRVINSTDEFAEKIYDIAEVTRDQGGLAAYRYIGDQRRLSADYLRH